jgi:hypothetical protein
VAVYPVDARGLMTAPMYDAANSGRGYARNPGSFGAAAAKFNQSQADEHITMEQMAEDTGGHAFYNTNGLAEAVAKAMEAGSNYYTVSYIPSDRRQDGRYRSIHVDVTGVGAQSGLRLAYRHGYYAPTATPASKKDAAKQDAGSEATDPLRQARTAYGNAAMARGAPTPEDILMKVRVLPASNKTEAAVAPGNVLDPNFRVAGPYQRYDVDYVAPAAELALLPQTDGSRAGEIEFLAYVYDADGRLLNAAARSARVKVPAAEVAQFERLPINFHLEISAPARQETYLRVAMRDVTNNRFGVVEVPASTVSHLPPPVYPPATAPPATSAPASTAPSTTPPPAGAPPR